MSVESQAGIAYGYILKYEEVKNVLEEYEDKIICLNSWAKAEDTEYIWVFKKYETVEPGTAIYLSDRGLGLTAQEEWNKVQEFYSIFPHIAGKFPSLYLYNSIY